MGRDVKGKNQGMDGTCSADPGTRTAAEERATEERTTDERTMEDIIKDATDRYLDSFPEKEITVSDLEDMVSARSRICSTVRCGCRRNILYLRRLF